MYMQDIEGYWLHQFGTKYKPISAIINEPKDELSEGYYRLLVEVSVPTIFDYKIFSFLSKCFFFFPKLQQLLVLSKLQ